MAKITGPLHSVEARGRMGGLIYNSWRGISYAKAFAGPSQPRSERQLFIRAFVTQLVRDWQSITQLQRDDWNDYAAAHPEIDWTGNSRRLTGLNWFVRCNLRLIDLDQSPIDAAPDVAAPDPVSGFAAADGVDAIDYSWDATAGTNLSVDVWLYGPHSPGEIGQLPKARHNLYAAGESAAATTDPADPGFYTVFYRTIDEDTGLDSTWQKDTVIVSTA